MSTTACLGCGATLDVDGKPGPAASLTGGLCGDAFTESWFRCGACDRYTVEVHRDAFLGEATVSWRGPVARAEGDRTVELIRGCPEPWDKACRCPAHRTYFEGALD